MNNKRSRVPHFQTALQDSKKDIHCRFLVQILIVPVPVHAPVDLCTGRKTTARVRHGTAQQAIITGAREMASAF
jgi:hypothetical protein